MKLRIGEAAKFLNHTTTTLRNWDKTGRLVPDREGKHRFYTEEQLIAFQRELCPIKEEFVLTKFTGKTYDGVNSFIYLKDFEYKNLMWDMPLKTTQKIQKQHLGKGMSLSWLTPSGIAWTDWTNVWGMFLEQVSINDRFIDNIHDTLLIVLINDVNFERIEL